MFQKRRSYTGPDSTPPTYEAGSQDHMASQAPTIHKSISPHDNIGGDASLAMRRYSTYDKYNTSENTQVSPYSTLSKRTSVLGDAIMAAMGRAKSPSISSAGSAEAPKEPRSQEPRQRRRISVYDALFTPYPFPDDEVAIQTAYLAKSSSELGAQSLKSTPSSLDVQPNATSKISSRTRRSSGLAEPHSAYTSSHLPTGSSHLEPVLKTPSPGSSLCDVSRELTVPPAPAIPAIPAVPVVPVLLEPPDTNLLSVSIPLSASHSQSGSAVYLKQPAVLGGSASVSAPASTSHIASSPTGSLGRPGYNPEPTTPKKKKFSVRQLLSKLGVRSKNTKE
ncbi:uncharacterized protein BJ171DRAFT_517141 [Polychytrium aggregatum]|uniref:uncharacterized protein n=1 Tax=Polychytrium aggregatum TaxID=110093 RepID=UPI0022FDE5D0|nr:uncharacterized protein BJ171DRAFT_517141 [Polychytrium aggregatum]KAI9199821.1 hypothetical protein BJ171DRAFT_517141 [Polychytrium aggregatum]